MELTTSAEQSWRGGARIGIRNFTWPFARLTLSDDCVVLKVMFLGTYSFSPDQVIQVDSFGSIPFIGKGVRIHHRHTGYPEKIVFRRLTANPIDLVEMIRSRGFGQP